MAKKKNLPLSANRAVAYNLALARRSRGWTQEQAAEALEEHLGQRWSKASWSAAERSFDGTRVREFTADEIVALSETFGLPVGWWFLPPQGAEKATQLRYTAVQFVFAEMAAPYLERLEAAAAAIGPWKTLATAVERTVIERVVAAQANEDLEDFQKMLAALLSAFEKARLGAGNGEEEDV